MPSFLLPSSRRYTKPKLWSFVPCTSQPQSPSVIRMKGGAFWALHYLGQQVSAASETTAPEEPSLPHKCCRALWGSDGQKETGLLGWLERLSQGGGWCLQAQGQWPLPGLAGPSVAADSSWPRVRAAARPARLPPRPGCWARVQEVLGPEQVWHREHRYHGSAFGRAGPGSPKWSPRAWQMPALATGPQPLCSLGCAAQHSAVLHLRFMERRNKTGDKYMQKEMGAPSAPKVWGFLS